MKWATDPKRNKQLKAREKKNAQERNTPPPPILKLRKMMIQKLICDGCSLDAFENLDLRALSMLQTKCEMNRFMKMTTTTTSRANAKNSHTK